MPKNNLPSMDTVHYSKCIQQTDFTAISFFLDNGTASNLSSMVATTYAGRRANGDKKRKEILFMDRKEILSAHLVRCCLTVLSEETRAPLPLLEPFWSQGDCECGRLLRARSPIHSLSN